MLRFSVNKKENIGISPDSILLIGEKKLDFTRIRLIDYDLNNLKEFETEKLEDFVEYDKTDTTSWINIDGLHDEKIMRNISDLFDIDTLIISEVLNTHGRPRIVEYDNCIHISIKMLQFDEKEIHVSSENLSLIVTENILFSFQERVGDVFEPVRNRLRRGKKRIRSSGTDYLTFALLDIVIDNYMHILSRLGEKIESLDDNLIKNPTPDFLEEINKYKSEVNYLGRAIKPCREMIFNLAKVESDLIGEEVDVHFKELQHNINQVYDSLDTYRVMLSDQLNIFHTNISYKLNEIFKVLTIFSVIFIPMTFVAGIYGTNFENIPELKYKYSYFIMWGVNIVIAISMILYFKRKKWF